MCPCCIKKIYFEITKGLINRSEKIKAVRAYVDSIGTRLFRIKKVSTIDICDDNRLTKKEKAILLKELLFCVDNY